MQLKYGWNWTQSVISDVIYHQVVVFEWSEVLPSNGTTVSVND